MDWVDELELQNSVACSELTIEVSTIGTSTEGRPIKMVKFSTGGAENKPAMFLDGSMSMM